ncbi:MAG: hypothetical protein JWM99_152 [Verrucomicrobiales bacterium]|nr:hypothetical protein [Verrucomicrobiales bacterium]
MITQGVGSQIRLCPGLQLCRPSGAGYLSRNPTNRESFVLPITWSLNEDLEVSVAMRPSATADIRLTNGDGQPLANVEVVFWPNTQWATFWSTIFASDFYRSLEVFHGKEFVSTEPQKRFFSANTDRNGRALIKELPPFSLPLSIVDESYELPLRENSHESTINLIGGQANYTILKLQKKGMQQRE